MYIGVVFYSSLNFAVSPPHQAGIMKVRSASVDKNYERKPFLKLRENSTEKAKTTKEKSWANVGCCMQYFKNILASIYVHSVCEILK